LGIYPERLGKSDTQYILQNCADAGDAQHPDHLRPAFTNQLQPRAQADGGHEGNHQQIAQRWVGVQIDVAVA
jgi:hypothetical protein